ncbi:MAG: c-type cytochrome [Acidobacteria bacterium]|nr:c-type cytochrome [Acidobacteriota bacterium]
MKQRTAWAAALVFAALVATFSCIKCDAEASDSSDVPSAIRYEANVSAGGVNPAGVALENPYKDDLQSAQTGERLFSSMNCDGCHGGGALGWVGPSLVDGRWRYGGADEEIFHSIFYGRPKGMPAYGGLLGSEGVWMIVTYLKSQPVPTVVPTTSYEDLATNATPDANVPTSLVALQPALPATGVEGMLAKYGCVACHTVEKKVVGPAFKDVAAKYRAQTGAAAYLAVQVKNGGAGVWGMIPMPPHSDVSTTDLDAIIAWILTSK